MERMSDAIGPGDWVQRIKHSPSHPQMRVGTVWFVTALVAAGTLPCVGCRVIPAAGLVLLGSPLALGEVSPQNRRHAGWCPCSFRPYQGPEQAKRLTCKPISEPA